MSKTIANDSGASTSLWMRTPVKERHRSVPDALEVDVCVIGAGIAGISTAYELVLRGKRVIVLDDGPVAGGETARSTAHLSWALDDGLARLEVVHGRERAAMAARSHRIATDRIEGIAHAEGIDCRFRRRDGYLFDERSSLDALTSELDAAHRIGLHDAELVDETPLLGFDAGPAVRFPRQATIDPVAYVGGLAERVERHGGRIFTGVHVDRVDDDAHEPRVITSTGEVVLASHVVIATNAPIHSATDFATRQAAHRTYVIGLVVPSAQVTPALFWDMGDPYHYVRLADEPRDDGADVLLVGGEDHRTGQAHLPESRYRDLERWARERFPMAAEVVYQWSGQVMEPVDGLAFIGPSPGSSNVLVITGDSGHGITHGVIGSILCTELVFGRSHEWAALYDPARRSVRAMAEYVRDGIASALQYGAWFRGGDVASRDAIPVGSGAVVQRGFKKLAVYRDEKGRFHERSAVCPHLGGIVTWNSAEKTWDCPCHGSRFAADGHVINGPANERLAPPPDHHPRPAAPEAPDTGATESGAPPHRSAT